MVEKISETMHQNNIFNIPIHENFLANFSDWFVKKFANQKCTVIFSHQSCINDFKQQILTKTKFLPTNHRLPIERKAEA